MASLNSVYLGFLLIVLCLSHGSSRKIISDHDMLRESKRQLSETLPPDVVSVPESPKKDGDESKKQLSETLPPDFVSEPRKDGDKYLDAAHKFSPVTSLDDNQAACGHPACEPQAMIPNCPSHGCAPAYNPFPKHGYNPASPPRPKPFYPPQPAPFYPPQPELLMPPQPAPMYPPQPEPLMPPQPIPMYPPQPEPLMPHQPAPMYPSQPEPLNPREPAYPPQPEPLYPPQPAYPPAPSPGCQPTYQPKPEPLYAPQPNPGCQPACQTEPANPPQPEPFYPPQAQPTTPPSNGCMEGLECPGSPRDTQHEVKPESVHNMKEGGLMDEQKLFVVPSASPKMAD